MLAQELENLPSLKSSGEEKFMRDLNMIFGKQIYRKWNRCLLTIIVLKICYVFYIFMENINGLNLWPIKKQEQFFMLFFLIMHEPNRKNQLNYGSIKGKNSITTLGKNGQMIIIFS